MNTVNKRAFHSVVSPFQIQLVAAISEIFGSINVRQTVEVTYNTPSEDGRVAASSGWPGENMPFELYIEIKTVEICVGLYPNGANSYVPMLGKYQKGQWELRCEQEDFANLNELSGFFIEAFTCKLEELGFDMSEVRSISGR